MLSATAAIVAAAFVAALLRGFTGFGFGIIAVPLLSLALPPATAVPLVMVLQVLVGATDFRASSRLCDWRSVLWLCVGMVAGTPFGLLALTRLAPAAVRLAIGAMIGLSAIVLWRGARLPAAPGPPITIAVGALSGVMNGLAAMSGPPVVAFFLAMPHRAAVVRASSIVFFVITAAVGLVPMSAEGLVSRRILLWSAASLPALFVGSRIGAWGFVRSRPGMHRRVALTVLLALAALLIGRALLG